MGTPNSIGILYKTSLLTEPLKKRRRRRRRHEGEGERRRKGGNKEKETQV
jgi:hypothetical protein